MPCTRLLGLLSLFIAINTTAQVLLVERDSLPIEKPKQNKSTYKLNHPALGEISIVTNKPIAVSLMPKKSVESVTDGILTLFTGINTTTSTEAVWLLDNELVCANPAFSWRVQLFFNGEFVKNRERVKNDDGSTSVEVQKGIVTDWSKGAYGLIMEKSDTLGVFNLATNLQEDPTSLQLLNQLRSEAIVVTDKLKYFYEGQGYNYTVSGAFRDQAFSMITSGSYYRSLVMMEEKPKAVFQSEPNYITFGTKSRLSPYILISKSVDETDKTDLIRLALLNSLLTRCVSVDFYPK